MVDEPVTFATGAVCSTTQLFHYFLGRAAPLDGIASAGLVPYSVAKLSQGSGRGPVARVSRLVRLWRLRRIYKRHFETSFQRPYSNSGIFLTPIDFRVMPGSLLERRSRVALPLGAVDREQAVLTWTESGRRVSRPLTAESLAEAAAKWPAAAIREWFGKNPRMLFFHVPQVMSFQERIGVDAAWIEPGSE